MFVGLDLVIGFSDFTVNPDEIAYAARLAITGIGSPIGNRDFEILITEQIKGEVILLLEFFILFRCVITDAQHYRVAVF